MGRAAVPREGLPALPSLLGAYCEGVRLVYLANPRSFDPWEERRVPSRGDPDGRQWGTREPELRFPERFPTPFGSQSRVPCVTTSALITSRYWNRVSWVSGDFLRFSSKPVDTSPA